MKVRYRKSDLRTALVHAADALIAQSAELDRIARCAAADSRVQVVPACSCAFPWGVLAVTALLFLLGGYALGACAPGLVS